MPPERSEMVGWALVLAIRDRPITEAELVRGLQGTEHLARVDRGLATVAAIEMLGLNAPGEITQVEVDEEMPMAAAVRYPPPLDYRDLRRFLTLIGVLRASSFNEVEGFRWWSDSNTLVKK